MDTHTTFDYRIDTLSPETLPMVRLAEYAAALGKLMGSEEHVHLLKVRKGSAIPEIWVDHVADPKVRQRLSLVNTPDAPDDIKSNWIKIAALNVFPATHRAEPNTRAFVVRCAATMRPISGRCA